MTAERQKGFEKRRPPAACCDRVSKGRASSETKTIPVTTISKNLAMKLSFALRGKQKHSITWQCKYNNNNNNNNNNNVAVPLILKLPKIEAEKIMKY